MMQSNSSPRAAMSSACNSAKPVAPTCRPWQRKGQCKRRRRQRQRGCEKPCDSMTKRLCTRIKIISSICCASEICGHEREEREREREKEDGDSICMFECEECVASPTPCRYVRVCTRGKTERSMKARFFLTYSVGIIKMM